MKIRIRTNRDGFKRIRNMASAFVITRGDLQGPVLVRLGQVHRRQQNRIYSTEGGAAASGTWPALSPTYAAIKRRLFGRKKILQRTGRMKTAFTKPSSGEYIQEYVPKTDATGVFRFGAYSEVASYHYHGNSRLPVRDMVTKTAEQIVELYRRLIDWYTKERIPQIKRHHGPLIQASRPKVR